MTAPLTQLWVDDADQFDFYDRQDVVEESVDAVVRQFRGGA
ncbi:MAG: hypothetical protein AAGN46_07660 [Acidobacteriota bacterium]